MKNRTKGILWLVAPIIGLAVILSAYAITQFVSVNLNPLPDTNFENVNIDSSDVQLGENDIRTTVVNIINVLLGFLGIVTVVLIFVGIGLGIYYLTQKDGIELPHLGKEYGGFWRRVAAYIIDAIVLYVAYFIIEGIALFAFNDSWVVQMIFSLMYLVAAWLYYALFESSKIQATPGKLALSMKVTNLHGKKISFGRATGRHFAKILSSLILYFGFFMIGWTNKKQGLHDKIAGCYVIKD